MDSLSLQARLKAMVGLFVVGFMAVGAVAARTVPRVVVNGPVYADIVRGKDLVADILPPPEYVIESYLVVLQLLRESDAAGQAALAKRLETLRADFETRHVVWVRELPEGRLKQKMVQDSYVPAVAFYDVVDRQLLPALRAGDHARAEQLASGALKEHYEKHRHAIDAVVELANAENAAAEASAAQAVRVSLWALVGAAVLVLIFAVLLGMWVTHAIDASLRLTISSLKSSAQTLSGGASQLAETTQHLAGGATEQSAQIQQTTASLRLVEEQGRHTLSLTTEAEKLMQVNLDNSSSSQRALHQMTAGMKRIEDDSSDMARIIKTIDEIAFQTNLLALNAAVEAARAGEAGLGFAVVAEEVRNLARRAAEAARDTQEKLAGNIRRVADTSSAITAMDKDFGAIIDSATQLREHISALTSSTTVVITEVDKATRASTGAHVVVQRNTTAAHESAEATEELSGQARELDAIVSRLTALVEGGRAQA